MVSDTELITRLQEILRSSDLNSTTAGAVRRQLESDFSVDLSHHKKFISTQIDLFLNTDYLAAGDVTSPENDASGEGKGENEAVEEEEGDDEVFSPGNDVAGDGEGENEGEEEEEVAEDEDDDDDVDKEEDDVKNGRKKRSKEVETNKKRGGGFTKLCSVSPQLQEFLGVSEMARTQVVKKIWDYIKEHDLQDPKNRRNIKCDEKLRSIFRVNTINMFQMSKALSKHIWPLEEEEEPTTNSPPPEKKQRRQKEEDAGNSKVKAKQQKGGTTGFLKPLKLSDAFVNFLGTGETTLSRADAVKRIWDYIKRNNLQDPSDKRRVLCDEKLKELFDVESFTGFSVTKLLTTHLTKIEQ